MAWEDSDEAGDGDEIRARLFNRQVNPQGPDFRVNTLISGIQRTPRLGDFGPMGFLVTWSSTSVSAGTDTDESVQARLINGPGSFAGPQIQYNVWETNAQKTPVSHGWYGRLGSAWEGVGNDQDATHDHITGRHIEACIFCEDSEWGSSWRWSVTEDGSP